MNEELKKVAQHKDLIEGLMQACQQQLGYDESPALVFVTSAGNAENPLGKTAYYSPDQRKIAVYVSGRHIKDVMRSIAHECVHHSQNVRGDMKQLEGADEGYAQEDEYARELEREAYEKGNLIFRDYEDGLKYGEQ